MFVLISYHTGKEYSNGDRATYDLCDPKCKSVLFLCVKYNYEGKSKVNLNFAPKNLH